MESAADNKGRGLRGLIPIVDWRPRYDRAMLRGDLLPGLAVTAMIRRERARERMRFTCVNGDNAQRVRRGGRITVETIRP